MPADPLEFANDVGSELARQLGARSRARLAGLPGEEQFSAALGASLVCVAEVLRGPVERGMPPARLAALCARQLEELLAPAVPGDGAPEPPPPGDG